MVWGFSAVNNGMRRIIDNSKPAYAYLGKVTAAVIPGSGSTIKEATFTCAGRPLLFYELSSTDAMGIHRLEQLSSNTWRVLALGPNPIRIFGRVDLNWPNGFETPGWGWRLRRMPDGAVTFDSRLRMLRLAGYTAYTNLELALNPSDPENLLPVTPPLNPAGKSISWQPNLMKWSYKSVALGGGQSTSDTTYQKPSWKISGQTLINVWAIFSIRVGPGSGNLNASRYIGGTVSAPCSMINNADFP